MKARGHFGRVFIVSRCLEPLMKPEARFFDMVSTCIFCCIVVRYYWIVLFTKSVCKLFKVGLPVKCFGSIFACAFKRTVKVQLHVNPVLEIQAQSTKMIGRWKLLWMAKDEKLETFSKIVIFTSFTLFYRRQSGYMVLYLSATGLLNLSRRWQIRRAAAILHERCMVSYGVWRGIYM